MLRRLFRFVLTLGIIGAIAAAVAKLLGDRQASSPVVSPVGGQGAGQPWPPLDAARDATVATKPAAVPDTSVAWVEPDGDVCPTTHPVKAKLASKIFHVPGGLSYERTNPDRCYTDAAAAEADGLRQAKR